MNIEVINLSGDKVSLYKNEHNEQVVDFGKIKKGSDATFSILIKSDVALSDSVKATCGCTTPSVKFTNEGMLLTVNYSNRVTGAFTKSVIIRSKDNRKRSVIKIKGDAV